VPGSIGLVRQGEDRISMSMIDDAAWQTCVDRRLNRGRRRTVVEKMGTKLVQQRSVRKIFDFVKPLQVGKVYWYVAFGSNSCQVLSRGFDEKSWCGFSEKVR
jgi:hypothetical protein